MSKKPPSDFARLTLFCELVDEYDELAAAFPLLDSREFNLSPDEPPADPWPWTMRAMALRKFVLSPSDQVFAATVLDSVDACLTNPSYSANTQSYRQTLRALGSKFHIMEGPEATSSMAAIVEDLIYGGLLHGDYGRHQRKRARGLLTHGLALWHFVGEAETFVRSIRNVTRLSIQEGILVDRSAIVEVHSQT